MTNPVHKVIVVGSGAGGRLVVREAHGVDTAVNLERRHGTGR